VASIVPAGPFVADAKLLRGHGEKAEMVQ
jgi:hypothetical protein